MSVPALSAWLSVQTRIPRDFFTNFRPMTTLGRPFDTARVHAVTALPVGAFGVSGMPLE
ncbi:hypothetical protein GCM10022221_67150 [Actinocorallia aurea]